MRDYTVVLAAWIALFFLIACATWTPDQKVMVCQESLRILVQPECVRLNEVGEDYVVLCNEVVSDAIVACDAGINEDPALICPAIASKAKLCGLVIDGDPHNVLTCERVIHAASLACTLALIGPG